MGQDFLDKQYVMFSTFLNVISKFTELWIEHLFNKLFILYKIARIPDLSESDLIELVIHHFIRIRPYEKIRAFSFIGSATVVLDRL